MYTLLKPIKIREELLNRKIRIFSAQDFNRLFQTSPYATKYFLEEQTKQGLFLRLKRGLYALKTDPPSEEEIANALYRPSYISFDYALAYYNIIPEMTYQITSATTKPTRLFTLNHSAFSYYTIKPEAYTGYVLAQRGEKRFYIADPEKAFVDYLYIISLGQRSVSGGRLLNDRMEFTSLNRDKILSYAKLYNWSKLNKLIEELL